MPTSNTPLPARELLALADAMAEALRIERDLSEYAPASHAEAASDRVAGTLGKWLAARSGSDMTAEERVILNLHRAYESGDPVALQAAFMEFNERARALAEAQKGKARDE